MSVTYTTAHGNARSLNILSEARDQTCILMDTSQIAAVPPQELHYTHLREEFSRVFSNTCKVSFIFTFRFLIHLKLLMCPWWKWIWFYFLINNSPTFPITWYKKFIFAPVIQQPPLSWSWLPYAAPSISGLSILAIDFYVYSHTITTLF